MWLDYDGWKGLKLMVGPTTNSIVHRGEATVIDSYSHNDINTTFNMRTQHNMIDCTQEMRTVLVQ